MAAQDDDFAVPGLLTSPSVATTSRPIVNRTSSSDERIRDRSAADTLRSVLSNSKSHSALSHHDRKLVESFQAASTSDKSFVTSVANCSKSLQEWCRELDKWSWSGNFEPESISQETAGDETLDTSDPELLRTRNYGGLSALQLVAHRNRLRHIQADLDKIDMAGMKDRALVTHLHANSLQSDPPVAELHLQSQNSRLDVLSALVTVALLEALPDYSRVQTLTQIWNARISVLELAPHLLTNIAATKRALGSAWEFINDQVLPVSDLEFEQRRVSLEEKVASLGQTIDFMLDTLEGLEDTLPGEWIDNFESLEEDYSSWVVAGRKTTLKHSNQREMEGHRANPSLAGDNAFEFSPKTQARDIVPDHTIAADISSPIGLAVEATETSRTPGSLFLPQERTNWAYSTLTPVLERRESDLNNLITLQSYKQAPEIQQSFNFQPREMRITHQPEISAHNRGISTDSVDSQIANPDGSYRFPVSRRQSIYRTASMATIGTIGRAQIRSVDLTRHAQRPQLAQKDEPRASLVRSQSAEQLQARRDFDKAAMAEDFTGDRDMTESISLDAIIQDLTEKFVASSSAIGALDESQFAAEQYAEDELEYGSSDVASQEPTLEERELDPVENSPEPSQTKIRNEMDDPEQEPAAELGRDEATITPNRPPRVSSLPISTDEQIDRRIDRILTTIPARINFSRRVQPDQTLQQAHQTPDVRNEPRNSTPVTDRSQTPSLTLAPAEAKEPRAAKSSGNSAIRLYYLSQAGRQNPIKLYVRLVGENGERVMVRVGGGWADLGEYLRDYASHHSRTVMPEPNEQLQAVDPNQPTNSRVFSLPAIKNRETSALATPPESPIDEKRWSGPKSQKISKIPGEVLQVPSRRSSLPKKDVKKVSSLQDLSSQEQNEGIIGSDKSAMTDNVETPGPRRLSEEKREWLEQMVSKAKKWKAEGGASQHGQSGTLALGLAEMGSVGATRRVYRVSDGPLNNANN